MTMPAAQYLVAFNNGLNDDPNQITAIASPGTVGAANVWTDITRYVESHQISRGRQHELQQFQAGTCQMGLNNMDGRFSPFNTSSPYNGLLVPRKPVQVRIAYPNVAAPALVQTVAPALQSGSTTYTLTFGANITAGNALVLCVAAATTTLVSSVSGGGVTWTRANSASFTNATGPASVEIWYGLTSAGGSNTVTVTVVGSTVQYGFGLQEWSGLSAFETSGTTVSNTGSAATALTSASITPGNVGEPLFAVALFNSLTSTSYGIAPPAGWSDINHGTTGLGSNSFQFDQVYFVNQGTGSTTAAWSDPNVNGSACSVIASFTPTRVTYRRFTGYVDSWGTDWPDPTTSNVTLHATDAFRVWNLADFGPFTHTVAMLVDKPKGCWPLNDASNTTFADVSGNGNNLTVSPPSFIQTNQTGPDSNDPAINTAISPTPISSPVGAPSGSPFTVELWEKTSGNTVALWSVSSNGYLEITAAGKVSLVLGSTTLTGSVTVNDGNWHHIVATFAPPASMAIYVDGVLDNSSSGTASLSWTGATTSSFAFTSAGGIGMFSGYLSLAAQYAVALRADQVSTHYYLTAFPQESTGARVGRVLDCVGWSGTARNIDIGVSTVQANVTDLTNVSTLSHLQNVQATELGAVFIDGAGQLRFLARSTLWSQNVYITSQATIGDNTAGGDLPFVANPTVTLDDIDLYNEAVGTRTGGVEQRAQDGASIAAYGRNTWNPPATLIGISDTEVFNMLQWIVNQHKTPITRVQSVTVDGYALQTAGTVASMLALELLYRVTVERVNIPGGGSSFSQIASIEKIDEKLSPTSWTVTFGLAKADAGSFILGMNQLGITTALGF